MQFFSNHTLSYFDFFKHNLNYIQFKSVNYGICIYFEMSCVYFLSLVDFYVGHALKNNFLSIIFIVKKKNK